MLSCWIISNTYEMIGLLLFSSGVKCHLLVFALIVFALVCVNGQNGEITCYKCENIPDNTLCTDTGRCGNMEICMNEVRDENDGHRISKSCKARDVCTQDEMQNENRCHPEQNPSKCVYCCDTDNCNEQENPGAVNDITATPAAVLTSTFAADATGCIEALGMGSGGIKDEQITSSSSFSSNYPFKGRLNNEGCWIPVLGIPPTVASTGSWIEVNLLQCYIVSGIVTQGSGETPDMAWITELQIQYGSSHVPLVNILDNDQLIATFQANTDKDTSVTIKLSEPIKTQLLRIVPISCNTYLNKELCALRFEVLGCLEDEYDFNSDGCISDKATCVNTEESIKCTCNAGYEEDSKNCKDIDECAQSLQNCGPKKATCVNTEGSFTCICNAGYKEESGTCQDACQEGWDNRFNACYKLMCEPLPFNKAKEKCQEYGGNLTSIHSAPEQEYHAGLMGNCSRDEVPLWIGLTDQCEEDNFTNVDGTPFNYTNWAAGEPNNGGEGEDCVHLFPSNEKWNDLQCGTSLAYICKQHRGHIAGTNANRSYGVAPTICPSTTTSSTSALTSASTDRVITTSPQTTKSTATLTTTDDILPTSSPRSTTGINTAALATTLTGSDTTSPSTAKISNAASTASLIGGITTLPSTGKPTTTLTDEVTTLIRSTTNSTTASSTATLTTAIHSYSNSAATTMTMAALTDGVTTSSSTVAYMATLTDDIPTSSTSDTITSSGVNNYLTTLTEGPTTSPSTSKGSSPSTTTFAHREVNEVPFMDEFEDIARCVRQNTTFNHANLVIKDLNISEMRHILLEQGGSTNILRLQATKPVRAIITQSENLHMQVSTKFEEKKKAESRIVSRVMSIDLFDQITGEEISSLEQPLTIVFETIKPNIPSAEKWEITPRCSFWNKVDGFWSDGGCKMVAVNGSKVECECDHLTSFAVLMQFVSYPLTSTDQKVLGVLSTLGLSVSVVCTCLTLAIYAYCRLLAFPRVMIHTNLCVALLNSHLIFLAGIEVNKHHETACIAIALLLHYFLMSTFFWMLVEAIYLLMKTKASLSRRKVPVLAWIAVGWGLPLIVVAISALSNIEGYGYPVYRFSGDNQIIKTFRCWLEIDNGMIWAFVGPACFIIMVNLAILIMVLSTFLGLKATKNQSQLRRIKSSIRVVVVLGAILALPWIISLLNFSQYTVIFNYLFVLTNAFQGMFFLIYQCLMAEEVQTKLKPLIRELQRKITRNHGNEARSNHLFMIVRPAHVRGDSSGIPNPTATTSDGGTEN